MNDNLVVRFFDERREVAISALTDAELAYLIANLYKGTFTAAAPIERVRLRLAVEVEIRNLRSR